MSLKQIVGAAIACAVSCAAGNARADGDAARAISQGPVAMGFAFALRLSHARPFGDIWGETSYSRQKPLSDVVKSGNALAGDALFVPSPHVQFGVYVSYAALENGPMTSDSTYWLKYGGQLQFQISPGAPVGPWFGVGVGKERIKTEGRQAISGSELPVLSGGVDFALSPTIGAGPYVEYAKGTFEKYGGAELREERATHHWLSIGIRGVLYPRN